MIIVITSRRRAQRIMVRVKNRNVLLSHGLICDIFIHLVCSSSDGNGNSSSGGSSTEEIDVTRHREITSKAVSAILLLMLKHLKLSRILFFSEIKISYKSVKSFYS